MATKSTKNADADAFASLDPLCEVLTPLTLAAGAATSVTASDARGRAALAAVVSLLYFIIYPPRQNGREEQWRRPEG